jgi:hypothetical protein
MIETIAASRCPRCGLVVTPPTTYCPHHPVAMVPTALPGVGEVVSFTTLHTPPAGFRSPLHIALVELDEGGRLVCHGAEVAGLKIGATVAIEAIDNVYYFSHLGAMERARLFWRRAGHAGERVNAIARSLAKRVRSSLRGVGRG